MPGKSRRVPPKGTVVISDVRVTNRTANSIKVTVTANGTVQVTDCCLEEQGK